MLPRSAAARWNRRCGPAVNRPVGAARRRGDNSSPNAVQRMWGAVAGRGRRRRCVVRRPSLLEVQGRDRVGACGGVATLASMRQCRDVMGDGRLVTVRRARVCCGAEPGFRRRAGRLRARRVLAESSGRRGHGGFRRHASSRRAVTVGQAACFGCLRMCSRAYFGRLLVLEQARGPLKWFLLSVSRDISDRSRGGEAEGCCMGV